MNEHLYPYVLNRFRPPRALEPTEVPKYCEVLLKNPTIYERCKRDYERNANYEDQS